MKNYHLTPTLDISSCLPKRTKLFERTMSAFQHGYRIIIQQGGTSSSKTYSTLQMIIFIGLFARRDGNKPILITVCGQDFPNLRAGPVTDIQDIIAESYVLRTQIRIMYGGQIIRFKNGNRIEFKSYDNAQDAKSGRRDYLFMNEANGIPYEIFRELHMRTRVMTFIDYNPNAGFWAHHKLLGRPDAIRLISTYKDNQYCPTPIITEIEGLKETDPNAYRVYGLGYTGVVEGLIFPVVTYVKYMPTYISYAYGIDYGYTVDKTAIAQVGIDGDKLYLRQRMYETSIDEDLIADNLMSGGVDGYTPVISETDHAIMRLLKKKGFNVIRAEKGPDSVSEGITLMKKYKICIHYESFDFKKEQLAYSWQRKDEQWINKPRKGHDHLWDASRYAFMWLKAPTLRQTKGKGRRRSTSG